MALRISITAVLTLLPIVGLLRFFYKRDLNPEPRAALVGTFVRGILVVIPVLLVAGLLSRLFPAGFGPWFHAWFVAFVLAALPEEYFKLRVLTRYSAIQPCFDEPMDGIVYGATAALGFAALENVMYAWSGGWSVALLRAFTAVPMHAVTGAMLGYGIAREVFPPNKSQSILGGFIAAVVLHGLYDLFLLGAQYGVLAGTVSESQILWLFALSMLVLIVGIVWTIRTVQRLRRAQKTLTIDESPEEVPTEEVDNENSPLS